VKKFCKGIVILIFCGGVILHALSEKGVLDQWTRGGAVWDQLWLKVFPDDAGVLNRLAETLAGRAEYQEAIKAYPRLVELQVFGQNADSSTANEIIEKVSRLQGYYESAIRADPDFHEAYLNLARLYKNLGRLPAAFAVYTELSIKRPDVAETWFQLGQLRGIAGDDLEAIASFEKFLQIRSNDEPAILSVLEIYNNFLVQSPVKESWHRARRDAMERLIESVNAQPRRADGYYNLGIAYFSMEDVPSAVSAWQSALDLDNRHVATLNQLGDIYLRSGDVARAIDYFLKAVASRPSEVTGYLNLGRAYLSAGNDRRAEQYFLEVLRAAPDHEVAHFSMGYLNEKRHKLREALRHYEASAKANPANAEAFYNSGNVHAALMNYKDAQRAYRLALQINPNHLNAAVNSCLIALRQKEFESAVELCGTARLLGYPLPEEAESMLKPYR
jgi:tetratricopeptide (TPR) repeat protein